MPSEYSGNELFPGSLRGYRAWSLDYNYLVLHAINSGYGGWEPGVNKAGCTVGTSQYSCAKHTVPNKDHTCGFYCRYDPEDLDGIVSSSAAVFGAVDVHGKLILGTRGLRAEYAEIVALTYENCEISKRIIDLYAEKYEVPVFETMEKLVKGYPRSDVSDLVPEPAKLPDLTGIKKAVSDLAAIFNITSAELQKILDVRAPLIPPSTESLIFRSNDNVTRINASANTYGIVGNSSYGSYVIASVGYHNPPQNFTWHSWSE